MDFFKQIKQPAKYEATIIEKGKSHLKGCKLTEEHKRKIGEASKNRTWTKESRKKLSESHKGVPKTDQQKTNLSESISKFRYQGKTLRALSIELGVHKDTIKKHLNRYGHLDNIYNDIKPQSYNGKTVTEWSDALGFSTTSIRNHLTTHGHLDILIKKSKRSKTK